MSGNKHAYALATLAFTIDIPNKIVDMRIIKKALCDTAREVIPANLIDEHDCRTSII